MERNNYGKKIVSGTVLLMLSGLIVKALGLIYKIPLSYILSDEGMGYFNSAYTVYTLFYIICTAGIPKAISILISESDGEGNSQAINSIYKTAMCVFGILGVIITVLFLIFANPISRMIGSNNSVLTMIAIAPSVMFVCAAGVIRGYFNGIMNFVPIAVSEAISGGARVILGLAFALYANHLGYDLTVVSALTILGTTIGSFFGFLYLYVCKKREKKSINTRQKYKILNCSFSITKRMLRIAIPLTLTGAIAGISGVIDLTVVMNGLHNSGFSELQAGIIYGNYTTLVIPMLNLLVTLIAPLSTVLLPLVSKGAVKNDSEALSDKISFVIKILCFISVPASLLFMLRSKEILSILFEDSGAVMGAPLLSVLAPGIIFMCLLTVINTSLEGMGDTKAPLISLIVGLIVKLTVSGILINNGNIGIYGAPIGTALSYVVSFIISAYYLVVRKKIKVRFLSQIFPFAVASFISIFISRLFRNLIFISNVYVYIAELVIFAVVYCSIALVFYYLIPKKWQKYTKSKYLNYI